MVKCLPTLHHYPDAKSRGQQVFSDQQDLRSLPPLCQSKQLLLSHHQGAYQFCIDTSSHLFDYLLGRSLTASSEQQGIHSSLHTSLGSPGKLSLIDAIYSFDPNDKITEKFSPTLHHTWEKSAQLLSANHNKNLINQDSAHSLLSSLFV